MNCFELFPTSEACRGVPVRKNLSVKNDKPVKTQQPVIKDQPMKKELPASSDIGNSLPTLCCNCGALLNLATPGLASPPLGCLHCNRGVCSWACLEQHEARCPHASHPSDTCDMKRSLDSSDGASQGLMRISKKQCTTSARWWPEDFREYLSDGEFAQYDAHWKQRDGHECDAKRHDKYSGGQRHDKYDAVFERIGMFLGSAIVRSNGCPCVRSDLALHGF